MARAETQESTWSFDQIYDEYKTPIYNYVYHLVGDREQADDLTQDTFLKAFRALPKMDANLKLSAWLYRIATNTAYDALRRRKLIAWLPWQDLDHEPADVESADPQEMYGTTELVRAALRRMPQQYRAALLLYTQEGFSYSEIAQALNIAESGVKMYLSRARQSFHRSLQYSGPGLSHCTRSLPVYRATVQPDTVGAYDEERRVRVLSYHTFLVGPHSQRRLAHDRGPAMEATQSISGDEAHHMPYSS